MPDLPAVSDMNFGFYDLTSGAWYSANLFNQKQQQYKIESKHYPDNTFTGDALAGEGIR